MTEIDTSAFTDRILIRLAPDQSSGQHVFTWAGTWPPPPHLIIVVEKGSDQYKLVNPADYPDVDWALAARNGGYTVIEFQLHRASELPEAAKPDEHWFRGAEYIPTGTRHEP